MPIAGVECGFGHDVWKVKLKFHVESIFTNSPFRVRLVNIDGVRPCDFFRRSDASKHPVAL